MAQNLASYTIPDLVNILSAAGTETPPARIGIHFVSTAARWFNSQPPFNTYRQVLPSALHTAFSGCPSQARCPTPCSCGLGEAWHLPALAAPQAKNKRRHLPFPLGREIYLQMGNLLHFLISTREPGNLGRKN